MIIEKVKIKNFKCIEGEFTLDLKDNINIIVGNNEAGKSTIIEAINLALTGLYDGRYLRNELSEYLFNKNIISEYLKGTNKQEYSSIPEIYIELYFKENSIPEFRGTKNTETIEAEGFALRICFDPNYSDEYSKLIESGEMKTLPIEFYQIFWETFARNKIITRSIPLKSSMIDSSSFRYKNGSDIYISKIVKNTLEKEDIINISQAHRKMIESFMGDTSIDNINKKVNQDAKITDKNVEISVNLSTQNAWENSLITKLDDIPFDYIGKGEQCIVKTGLSLANQVEGKKNIILMEEPENHLSFSNLNRLICGIEKNCENQQVIITTHSSFVANKLGLDNLILLENQSVVRLNDLKDDTKIFFEKIAGYDTLRFILCKKAILVEGDSDELIVQRAYLDKYNKLPIQDGIDVISVGTSFLRFLEIADKIQKKVNVVTDNDGYIDRLLSKYKKYVGENKKEYINICYDDEINEGNLKISGKSYNYNTLEPTILAVNELDKLNEIFETNYTKLDDLRKYMYQNKTDCALRIFKSDIKITYPKYILEAISDEK